MKKIEPVLERIRPKEPKWDFSGLEAVIKQWAKSRWAGCNYYIDRGSYLTHTMLLIEATTQSSYSIGLGDAVLFDSL